jgi:chromosome segregation ATPase
MNYPVLNDNRTLGLLKKFRTEISQLQNQVNLVPGDSSDNYNLKIAELEKKLIEETLEKMKGNEDKSKLVSKMQEMKSKFNELVKAKADMQGELIRAEEEKLKVSKALIELQIENTRMLESIQNEDFDQNAKMLHAETDILEANLKEERAAKAVGDL